jgi:hypothetical protein
MPRSTVVYVLFATLVATASGNPVQHPETSEWLRVLSHKQAADSPNAPPAAKQAYADALAGFVNRHPSHSRARDVYHRIQLDFAQELASHGRYQDAIRFYRAVLVGARSH